MKHAIRAWIDGDAIHHVQRFVASQNGVRPPDAYLDAPSSPGNNNPCHVALQQLRQIGRGATLAHFVPGDGGNRTGYVLLLLRSVADFDLSFTSGELDGTFDVAPTPIG